MQIYKIKVGNQKPCYASNFYECYNKSFRNLQENQ